MTGKGEGVGGGGGGGGQNLKKWEGEGMGVRGHLHKIGGHYKTNLPHSWLPPISSENFPSPHYGHFSKVFIPLLWKGWGEGGLDCGLAKTQKCLWYGNFFK